MNTTTHYDGIILGTGHNALILQAYLSRCGVRTLALDRAAVPGGGLMTIDNPRLPGFRHNPHSFFHRAITGLPWHRDLELERHGLRYFEPACNVAMILRDGRSIEWWDDLERTYATIAEFSKKDAATLRRFVEELEPILKKILVPEAQSPPLPPERRTALLQSSALGRRFLEISALSPLEFVERHFENDTVRACLMFINGMREIDLRLPGFGHSIPSLLAARGKAQMAAGGSASLAGAIIADIAEHGGEIRCGVELRRIVMRGGRAAGVELSTGEELHASAFIASGLNPQQTFLQLLDADAVPARVREQASRFKYNLLAPLLTLHLALDEPPRYTAAARRPELARAFMVIAGLERFEQFTEIAAAHERGDVPAPVAWGACPTVFDPSQAPPGKHTAFMWEKLPYALRGDAQNWEREKEAIGARLLAMWSEHAPNLRNGIIRDQFLVTPRDVERTLPNMIGGDSLVGSFENDQLRYHRPFAGAGAYRAPVPGLYLCGGSTHPGGNVTGLCGYNAARVLAADLGKEIWWNPPDVEQALASV